MAVPYYLGAQAIAERLGYKDTKSVMRLHLSKGLPIFKRCVRVSRGGHTRVWATSESAITAWELAQGQASSHALRAKQELRRETKQKSARAFISARSS